MKAYAAIILNSQNYHVGRLLWRRSNIVAVVDNRGVVRLSHARYLVTVYQ